MARKTIADLEQEVKELKTKLANIDAQRPGMTEAEKSKFDEQVLHRDGRIAELTEALKQSAQAEKDLKRQLDDAVNTGAVSEALDNPSAHMVDYVPISGTVGTVALPGADPITVGLFGKAVNRMGYPGVLVMAVSNSEAHPPQFLPEWVLSGSAGKGYQIKPSRI